MTEEEWLTCEAPGAMLHALRKAILHALRKRKGDRKRRLFACACVRRLQGPFSGAWERPLADSAEILVVAERTAEGLASPDEIARAELTAEAYAGQDFLEEDVFYARAVQATLAPQPSDAAFGAMSNAHTFVQCSGGNQLVVEEERAQASLLRCIFGNPFRPVTIDAQWLTSTVVALARGIYDDRAFDRMPILADALQDAGCDNADVLNHCRDAGPSGGGTPHGFPRTPSCHTRGCWVVDLVLGKA